MPGRLLGTGRSFGRTTGSVATGSATTDNAGSGSGFEAGATSPAMSAMKSVLSGLDMRHPLHAVVDPGPEPADLACGGALGCELSRALPCSDRVLVVGTGDHSDV